MPSTPEPIPPAFPDAVCPDDLAALNSISGGVQCSRCGRKFEARDGVIELLPRETFEQSSPESVQLQAYGASFSRRQAQGFYQRLGAGLAILGNGYLYSWAGRALEAFAAGGNLAVLDAACGDGLLRRYLSSRHRHTGVDFSLRPLLRANRNYPSTYFRADLRHLPFPGHRFPAAVCLQALQYLDQPQSALAQIARVLQPGGRLLLSVPNCWSVKYRLLGLPAIQVQRFDRAAIISLLSRDFEILQLRTQGLWVPAPKVSLHLPGVYRENLGLSWTIVAAPKKSPALS